MSQIAGFKLVNQDYFTKKIDFGIKVITNQKSESVTDFMSSEETQSETQQQQRKLLQSNKQCSYTQINNNQQQSQQSFSQIGSNSYININENNKRPSIQIIQTIQNQQNLIQNNQQENNQNKSNVNQQNNNINNQNNNNNKQSLSRQTQIISKMNKNEMKSQKGIFNQINHHIFQVILQYFIDSSSNQIFKNNGTEIEMINLYLPMKKFRKVSLKHYRALSLNLNNFSVSQMDNQDKEIHQAIFKDLFVQKNYQLINLIKQNFTEKMYEFLEILKQEINGYNKKNNIKSSILPNLTSLLKQNLNLIHIERIINGISKLERGLYVQRF